MNKNYNEIIKNDILALQGIAQYYINLNNDDNKFETIKDIFGGLSISQCIIYYNTTKRVDQLFYGMKNENYPVERIHGKMSEEKQSNKKI